MASAPNADAVGPGDGSARFSASGRLPPRVPARARRVRERLRASDLSSASIEPLVAREGTARPAFARGRGDTGAWHRVRPLWGSTKSGRTQTPLSDQALRDLAARLKPQHDRFAREYPGKSGRRQPV